jgi:hypothetical protein
LAETISEYIISETLFLYLKKLGTGHVARMGKRNA